MKKLGKLRYTLVGASALGVISLALLTASRADTIGDEETFILTCGIGGTCGGSSLGSVAVEVTGIAGTTETLTYTVSLTSDYAFIGGSHMTFGFDLTGDPTVTFGGNIPSGWKTVPPNSAVHSSPYPTFDYGLLTNSNGSSDAYFGPLSFTVSGTGLVLADVTDTSGNGSGYYFSADVNSDCTPGANGGKPTCGSNTGAIAWVGPPISGFVGEGAPGPLAGAGLPGIALAVAGLFGWRRLRRNAAGLAAA